MDTSDPGTRRDWNQEIFSLYEGRKKEREKEWQETLDRRLENTTPNLSPDAYAGTYRSATMGDILVEQSDRGMTMKTTLVEFEMTHWHLDTFLAEYRPWSIRQFAAFNIGPDGTVGAFEFLGYTFERVEEE
jgi:hypothetical protein